MDQRNASQREGLESCVVNTDGNTDIRFKSKRNELGSLIYHFSIIIATQ